MPGPAMKAALHSLTKEGRKEEKQKSKEQKEQRDKEKEQEKQIKLDKKNPKPKETEGEEKEIEMDKSKTTENGKKLEEKKVVEADGDKVKETKTTEKKSDDWNSSPNTAKKTETKTTEKKSPGDDSTDKTVKKEVHSGERNIAISPLDLEDRIRQLELQKKEDRELMLATEDDIIKRLELKRIAAETRLREADEEIYRLRTQAILENEKHHNEHKHHKEHSEHKHKDHSDHKHKDGELKEHKHHHKDHTSGHKEHNHHHSNGVEVAQVASVPQTQSNLPLASQSVRSNPDLENQRLILTSNETNPTMYSQNESNGTKGYAVPFQTPIVSTTMLPPSNSTAPTSVGHI